MQVWGSCRVMCTIRYYEILGCSLYRIRYELCGPEQARYWLGDHKAVWVRSCNSAVRGRFSSRWWDGSYVMLLANSKSIRQIWGAWQLDFRILLELASRVLWFYPSTGTRTPNTPEMAFWLDPCRYPRGYSERFQFFSPFSRLNVTRREGGSWEIGEVYRVSDRLSTELP